MKIRERLFLGFGLYILFAAASGFFAYKDLGKITTRLNLLEVADDITNNLLEVRRYEKNYLLFRDRESLGEVKKYLGALKRNIENIKAEIAKEIGRENTEMMKKAIAEYENLLGGVDRNLNAQSELAGMVRTSGRQIEEGLTGKTLQTFLVLRRYEKNLMLYKTDVTYDDFIKIAARLSSREDTRTYTGLVSKLYDLYKDEKKSIEEMRLKAREIQSFTENLSRSERAEIGATLKSSVNVVLFTLLSIAALGTIINIKLAASIATPIRRLEKITKKIAIGDFSEAIEVKGKDEIASLELSFNQMEDRLKDAMSSLEKTIEILQEKQAQLVEAEKLASIGRLAAGIAHEINNPLTSVLTFSSLLLEQCGPDDPRHERLAMIVRETTRARNIVRQVLNFAREAPLSTVKININQPVRETVDALSSQDSFQGIKVALDLSANLPEISVDPVQIGQVVSNILLNAADAIEGPGKIGIATRNSGGAVEIVFTDTGKGIHEEHLKRIFDPFFTTKDKTKGTGLGLAVSYGIIKKHGGDIAVSSAVGEGTTFIVRLPVNSHSTESA